MQPFPMRSLIALLLALAAAGAVAQATCPVWTGPPIPSGFQYASPGAACAAWVQYRNDQDTVQDTVFTQESLTINEEAGTYACTIRRTYRYCDFGGTYPACNVSNPSSSQAHEIQSPAGGTRSQGECPSEGDCVSGTTDQQNFTIGWSNLSALQARGVADSAFHASFVAPPVSPGSTACVNECTVNVGAAGAVWHSYDASSNGLYRISADYQTTQTGQACTSITEAADPTTAPVPCPGFQGTVNGVPVCLPSSTQDAVASTPYTIGNPAAGSSGVGPVGGRTGGTGGNAGGPPSPSDGDIRGGGGVVGTVNGGGETPEADGECGFGPNPPCKIDETGTAPGVAENVHDGKGDAIGAAEIGAIGTAAQGAPSTEWTWSFQLPSACATITLGAWSSVGWSGVVDVCQFQPMFHDVMSLVWIAAAIFGCITLVGRTLGS